MFEKEKVPVLIIGDESVASGIFAAFVSALAAALERMGEATLVYGRDCNTAEELGAVLEAPLKCIIGFQEKFLCCAPVVEKGIPCFQFIFDNPFELDGMILKRNDPLYITLFSDRGYMNDALRFCGQKNALFFPPGGNADNLCTIPASERNMDVAFLAGYRLAPGDDYKWEDDFYRYFYEYMLAHPSKTFREGAEELLKIAGESFEDDELASMMRLLKHTCNLATGAYRGRVVEQLLEQGVTLHVFGKSWDMYNGRHPERLIRHAGVHALKADEIYKEAKISLNVMSWHRGGITERIIESMLCGAVCVSDETSELKNCFANRAELLLFPPEKPEMAAAGIKYLLRDTEMLDRVAAEGQKKALEGHTWDLRAKQIMGML